MALTTVSAGNQVTQWDSDFFAQYVRTNRFKRYMGTDENSIIQLLEDLTVKKGGNIVLTLIAKLTGSGVTGDTALVGNEEGLANYDFKIPVDTLRHGVRVTDHEQQLTEIDLRNAAKTMLKLWSQEKIRDAIITALGSVNGVAFASAAASDKNTWTVNNADRVLFGSAVANYNATFATALLNVDAAGDKLSKGVVGLAKRLAKKSNPIIRPVSVNEDEETYVMFANPLAFRDLKTDLDTVLQNAQVRGSDNPLFHDGDLMYDGVIIREVPEIGVIAGAGAGGIDVAPNYLCGAQAVGVAWAKRTASTTDVTDYGFQKGVGIHEMRGIEKCVFNNKDHGVFTVFTAGVADA